MLGARKKLFQLLGIWNGHSVGELMRNDLDALAISPESDALSALSKMLRNDVSCLLVTEGGRLVGTICLRDLLRFLHLKLDLDDLDGPDQGPPVARRVRLEHEVQAGERHEALVP